MASRTLPSRTLTYEEALSWAESDWWVDHDPKIVVLTQLQMERLCMPFATYRHLLECVLGRAVWTWELVERTDLISIVQRKINKRLYFYSAGQSFNRFKKIFTKFGDLL